jgi:hypothetical protein
MPPIEGGGFNDHNNNNCDPSDGRFCEGWAINPDTGRRNDGCEPSRTMSCLATDATEDTATNMEGNNNNDFSSDNSNDSSNSSRRASSKGVIII